MDRISARVQTLLEESILDPNDPSLDAADDAIVRDFVRIARMTTLSDVARRKRDGHVWLRRNLSAMLASVEAHALALRTFGITPGRTSAIRGDARNLRAVGIEDQTIDAVVTSPPYSIALDYVKNDEHALRALGVDPAVLREEMTGVRGGGPKRRLALYAEDMRRILREVARVLKPGAKAAFVLGDATVDGQELKTTTEMGAWAKEVGLQPIQRIRKAIFGLYGPMKDEWVLLFQKP